MTEADLDYVVSIEHAPAENRFVGEWTKAQHKEALEEPGRLHAIVESVETGRPVGFILLAGIDSADRSIEFLRIVVDPPGQGYGRQAIRLLKRYVFDDLGAHRLWLDVKDFNARAQALYRSEGFVEEGKLRECVRGPASYESVLIMAILDREYESAIID